MRMPRGEKLRGFFYKKCVAEVRDLRSFFRDAGQTTRNGAYRASGACDERKAAEQITVLRESIFWKVKLFFYRNMNPGQLMLVVVEVNYAAVRNFGELLN